MSDAVVPEAQMERRSTDPLISELKLVRKALESHADSLPTVAATLADSLSSQLHQERRRDRWLIGVLSFIVALTLSIGWGNRQIGEDVKATQADGVVARERIMDCTTPEGECYKENEARTEALVDDLADVLTLKILERVTALYPPTTTTTTSTTVPSEG